MNIKTGMRRGCSWAALCSLALSLACSAFAASPDAPKQEEAFGAKAPSPAYTSAFLARSNEIHKEAEQKAAELSRVFNFEKLAFNGMLPPVVRPGDGGVAWPSRLCGPENWCAITQLERSICRTEGSTAEKPGGCEPLSWRDFVFEGLPLSPEKDIQVDQSAEAHSGMKDADARFERNLKHLQETYSGMWTYRYIQKAGLVKKAP